MVEDLLANTQSLPQTRQSIQLQPTHLMHHPTKHDPSYSPTVPLTTLSQRIYPSSISLLEKEKNFPKHAPVSVLT
ncbi:MAG: hypothetical protein RLZ35_565 [Pseudomonadota bacterium]|jgi:hypothetical protein